MLGYGFITYCQLKRNLFSCILGEEYRKFNLQTQLQLDVRNLKRLHHLGLKVTPELGPADSSIRRLHIAITTSNLRPPPRDRSTVRGRLRESAQVKVEILRRTPVDSNDDKLRVGGIVRSNHVVRSAVQDTHTLADVAGELRKDKVLLVCRAQRASLIVGINDTPAATVKDLPVHPSRGPQPPEVENHVAYKPLARRVALAVLAVPETETPRRGEGVDLVAGAAGVLVPVDVDPRDVLEGRIAEVLERGDGLVVVGLVRGGDGHAREAAVVELGAEVVDDCRLRGNVNVAAFLCAVGLPPVRGGLVEGLYRLEGDAPVVLCVLGNVGHVDSVLLEVPRLNVFAAVGGTGGVVVLGRPPHWRVGKELEAVCAATLCLLHHCALVHINVPLPGRRGRVGVGVVDPVSVNLPGRHHLGRDHHALAVDAVRAASAGIVTNYVEAKTGQARAAESGGLGGEEDVGKVIAGAEALRPPGERGSPSLPGATVRLGIDGGRCVCSSGGDGGQAHGHGGESLEVHGWRDLRSRGLLGQGLEMKPRTEVRLLLMLSRSYAAKLTSFQ